MWNWQITPDLSLTNAVRIDDLHLRYSGTLAAGTGFTVADYNPGLFNALYIRGPRVSPRCNSCAKHASRPDRRIPARQDL
jgi:hypothetical protein